MVCSNLKLGTGHFRDGQWVFRQKLESERPISISFQLLDQQLWLLKDALFNLMLGPLS